MSWISIRVLYGEPRMTEGRPCTRTKYMYYEKVQCHETAVCANLSVPRPSSTSISISMSLVSLGAHAGPSAVPYAHTGGEGCARARARRGTRAVTLRFQTAEEGLEVVQKIRQVET